MLASSSVFGDIESIFSPRLILAASCLVARLFGFLSHLAILAFVRLAGSASGCGEAAATARARALLCVMDATQCATAIKSSFWFHTGLIILI